MVVLTPFAAAMIGRFGARTTLVAGAVIVALGYITPTVLRPDVLTVVVGTAVVDAGIGLGYAAMPTLIMSAVPESQTGAADGTNTLMRALGTTVGSAVVGAVLSADAAGTTRLSRPSVRSTPCSFSPPGPPP